MWQPAFWLTRYIFIRHSGQGACHGQLATHKLHRFAMFHDVLTTFDRLKPTSKLKKNEKIASLDSFFFGAGGFTLASTSEPFVESPGFVFMPVWPYAILIACAALFLEYWAFKEDPSMCFYPIFGILKFELDHGCRQFCLGNLDDMFAAKRKLFRLWSFQQIPQTLLKRIG